MREQACPICRQGTLECFEGRLDQSGNSYLPTTVWRCPRCEYARFEPALKARWVPARREPVEVAAPGPKIAA